MNDIQISFTDKELTSWGGMILLKKLIERSRINEQLEALNLPKQGSNRGYNPIQLINQFWVSVWSGANRFEHLEVTRQDEVIRKMFGWSRMAGHKAFMRYFGKFSLEKSRAVFDGLYQWFFDQMVFDNYTLDLDSTVLTRYGNQEGAEVGYNPKKRGRASHHPLMAFVAECRMVVNFWLRAGNAYTTKHFEEFLKKTLERLGDKTIGLLRADSGFYDKAIFDHLEQREKPISYIIAAKFYGPIQRAIAQTKSWWYLDEGIEIAETMYQSPSWKKPRRMVMVRQRVKERPKAAGRTLRLFEDETIYNQYRYSCFITNLTLPPEQVWRLYRHRAEAEQRIKELKYDFAADSFNVQSFASTETTLSFIMMAYNLMSLFRQVILQNQVQPSMKTLRYQLFAVGAYMIKEGNAKVLKLSLAMKKREWFNGLWQRSNDFCWSDSGAT